MVDPDLDSDIHYDEQGHVDVNPEIDGTIEEYLERIIFTLSGAVDKQLTNVQRRIVSNPHQGELLSPNRSSSSSTNFVGGDKS